MDCYEAIDLMGDALEGGLAPHARSGLQGHLDECPPCRHYMDQLRATRDALGRLPPPRGSSGQRADLIDRFRKEARDGE